MKRYELWHSEVDGEFTFFPADDADLHPDRGAGARLIWTVDAVTWDEAQAKKHEFLGWELWQPMSGDPQTGSFQSPSPSAKSFKSGNHRRR